ncbi:tRNA pseudouridine(38/39) synthase-like [Xenia sp. Carnegie-2017]|uniref:tRNA pseudouridine(38/39) synthase-like n=1 Tax=Xenia sp. Carnegie-2017 TaxID=2897299 RepID=UPI001F03701C|nr:tRNA pseudouridine(38/39) synthase-like [Xenia sp. Carnegie-2017]
MGEEEGKRKRNPYEDLDREELLAKLTELEHQNKLLRQHLTSVEKNMHTHLTPDNWENDKGKPSNLKKKRKGFDFSRYNVRHVALKIAYLGWDYHGFASQENIENTIEAHLFNALKKSCLIEERSTCNYSRCGRTDKGVSAFAQVISLHVRSNLDEGKGIIVSKDPNFDVDDAKHSLNKEEINYLYVLNKLLPNEIRVIGWTPVSLDFKARFSCMHRMYKYYFPRGNLDLKRMNEAGQKFVGEHDFRNFCKMDIGNNILSFKRNILSVEIEQLTEFGHSEYETCTVTIKGMAFLWHQVRCIVAILFLIGQKLEEAEIIDHMLDITKCPRRPQYNMASEIPLVLYHCEYESLTWQYDEDEMQRVFNNFQKLWTTSIIRTTMIRTLLDDLNSKKDVETKKTFRGMCLIPGHHVNSYKKILTRALCDSLETKLENLASKRDRRRKKLSKV